jgi:hypothetical protein
MRRQVKHTSVGAISRCRRRISLIFYRFVAIFHCAHSVALRKLTDAELHLDGGHLFYRCAECGVLERARIK